MMINSIELAARKYKYEEWRGSEHETYTNMRYTANAIRMPEIEGFRLSESRSYGSPGSFRNIYHSEDGTGISVEVIAASCDSINAARRLMLHRLSHLSNGSGKRNGRWNCDVGFGYTGSTGVSQMVCRNNLFISITVRNVIEGMGEDNDRILEEVWNSLM